MLKRSGHGLAGSDAFEGGADPDPVGHVVDSRGGPVAAFGHDVGGAELCGERLPGRVAA
jgi:hypothetical protein